MAIALTDSQATSALAALGKLPASSLTISAVPMGDIATFEALSALTSMAVADTASAVQGDLASGHSVLETGVLAGKISDITVNDTVVALTDTQAEQVLHALTVLGGSGDLTVSDVSVGDLPTIGALSALTGMTVSDDAAAIKGDLTLDASSQLALHQHVITGMTVTGGPISLTEVQALAADPAALALLPADSLDVTGVAIGDIGDVAAIGTPLAGMTVSDDGGTITTDLQQGASNSALEHYAGKITGVTLTSGSVSLSDADAWVVTDALAKLPTGSLTVTGAAVGHVATYGGMAGLALMDSRLDTASAVTMTWPEARRALETYASERRDHRDYGERRRGGFDRYPGRGSASRTGDPRRRRRPDGQRCVGRGHPDHRGLTALTGMTVSASTPIFTTTSCWAPRRNSTTSRRDPRRDGDRRACGSRQQ